MGPRMTRLIRIVIVLCCTAVIAQAFILYAATGRRAFTRYPSPELAKMHEEQGSLTSLFDSPSGSGTPSGSEGPPLIANDFTFGLLPSPALSPEALSVSTIAGPALLAALLAMFAGRGPARSNANPSTAKETGS